jgi:PadR family transcriptional regulator
MAGRSNDLVQGTLDMLILKTLSHGRAHGYDIMRSIEEGSGQVLHIEEGSLYPALHRVKRKGWVTSEWGLSEKKRRARYYELTKTGMNQLETELALWRRLSSGTARVLDLNISFS